MKFPKVIFVILGVAIILAATLFLYNQRAGTEEGKLKSLVKKLLLEHKEHGDIEEYGTAIVPGWEWIEIMNLKPIRNRNTTCSFNDTCGIDRGGELTVLATHRDKFLVRYETHKYAAGTRAPSGTIFFVSQEKFSQMTERYQAIIREEQALKDLVKNLLSNSVEAEEYGIAIVPEWEWIKVMNLGPIMNHNITYYFKDTCGIDRGGELTVLATHRDKFLVRYETHKYAAGTRAPSGTIFFVSQEKFFQMKKEADKE